VSEDVVLENRSVRLLARLRLYKPAPPGEAAPDSEPRESAEVKLFVAKVPGVGQPLNLQEVRTETVELERGKDTLASFPYVFPAPGDYVVQVRAYAQGDCLDLDNTRSVVVSVRKELPVLLVNGKEAGPDGKALEAPEQSARYWLRRALKAAGA